jgi:hypothetical protein
MEPISTEASFPDNTDELAASVVGSMSDNYEEPVSFEASMSDQTEESEETFDRLHRVNDLPGPKFLSARDIFAVLYSKRRPSDRPCGNCHLAGSVGYGSCLCCCPTLHSHRSRTSCCSWLTYFRNFPPKTMNCTRSSSRSKKTIGNQRRLSYK